MSNPASGADRRANPHLRRIFVDAYDVLQPFFDPANTWAGQTHEHLAHVALHEQFPSLSAQELFVLVEAARRVFSAGGKPVAP